MQGTSRVISHRKEMVEFVVSCKITEPVAQLLNGKNFAYISTLMKDGSPQVTPTWIDIDEDGNSFLINTAIM